MDDDIQRPHQHAESSAGGARSGRRHRDCGSLGRPSPQSSYSSNVSSTIRENLVLGVRSGYAEATGSRSYMADKSAVIASCSMDQQLVFFAVCDVAVHDGHNRDETTTFLHAELHHRPHLHPPRVCLACTGWPQSRKEVCALVDDEILELQNRPRVIAAGPRVCVRPSASGRTKTRRRRKRTVPKLERGECEAKPLCQPISFSGAATVFFAVVATGPHVDGHGNTTAGGLAVEMNHCGPQGVPRNQWRLRPQRTAVRDPRSLTRLRQLCPHCNVSSPSVYSLCTSCHKELAAPRHELLVE